MNRYIIQGAGAVGSAIGGSLAKAGFDVALVARKPHVEAIKRQGGVLLKMFQSTEIQPVKAVESVSDISVLNNVVIFQTMKANDTESAAADLAGLPRNTPVVCWQNGVENESIVAKMFCCVYGGVVRFTATMMTPGEVRFAGKGKLILGLYPEGEDTLSKHIAADLGRCGFTALTSRRIMDDKWLKLLVNLISCVKPMTVKTSGERQKRFFICRNLLQEGIGVLEAAGIAASSTNATEDSPEAMLNKFGETLRLAEGVGQGMELQNSTWQTLAKRKKVLENDYYTGVIIRLGRQCGLATPYNESILFHLHKMADNGLDPETLPIENIIEKAEELSN